jgi:hypothetical protein
VLKEFHFGIWEGSGWWQQLHIIQMYLRPLSCILLNTLYNHKWHKNIVMYILCQFKTIRQNGIKAKDTLNSWCCLCNLFLNLKIIPTKNLLKKNTHTNGPEYRHHHQGKESMFLASTLSCIRISGVEVRKIHFKICSKIQEPLFL